MKTLALAGGVGGARMSDGFYRVLPPGDLTVLVNTGDDFRLHGLWICPDLDTVTYTLAGCNDAQQGWGIQGETYAALAVLEKLGAPTWFRLGDRDLALHVARTSWMAEGSPLSEVSQRVATGLGVHARVLPMCEQTVQTVLDTEVGRLSFQDYFVRYKHDVKVHSLQYVGIENARLPEVDLGAAELIVLCPSNPFLSIAPILDVDTLRAQLAAACCPRVAVSPIIAGQAVKGPAARLMSELGWEPSVLGIAKFYASLIDILVIDEEDRALEPALREMGLRVLVCPTRIQDPALRPALAQRILDFVGRGESEG